MDTRLPPPSPPTPVPASGRTAAGDTRTWFEAATPAGPVRLCTPVAVPQAMHAAVALARYDALLDRLDAWLGTELDWTWIGTPTAPLATTSHTYAEWRPAGSTEVAPALIEWPWALLRGLASPEPALAAQLHWPHVGAVLVAAQWRIEADQLLDLEPGGAVLLGPSFGSAWRGWLRAGYEPARPGIGVPVALASPDAAQVVVGPASAATVDESDSLPWCEVRLEPLQPLAIDRLTGWCVAAVGAVEPQASLWRCATASEPARHLAAGRLLPWGDGWALALECVGDHAGGPPTRMI